MLNIILQAVNCCGTDSSVPSLCTRLLSMTLTPSGGYHTALHSWKCLFRMSDRHVAVANWICSPQSVFRAQREASAPCDHPSLLSGYSAPSPLTYRAVLGLGRGGRPLSLAVLSFCLVLLAVLSGLSVGWGPLPRRKFSQAGIDSSTDVQYRVSRARTSGRGKCLPLRRSSICCRSCSNKDFTSSQITFFFLQNNI